jgi:hypothetical protein
VHHGGKRVALLEAFRPERFDEVGPKGGYGAKGHH